MPCDLHHRHALADEIDARQKHLLAGVERWLTLVAERIDTSVSRSTAPLEDLVRAHRAVPDGDYDELAAVRAARAHADLLTELAAISAALRLGPPPGLGYRLASLSRELRERSPS